MPKVLMFTGHTSLKIGGLEEFFVCLGAEMPGDILLVENDYDKIPDPVRTYLESGNVRLHHGRIRRALPRALGDIASLLREYRPDIVHVHFPPVSYLTIVLAKLFGARRIYWTKHTPLAVGRFSKSWWYHRVCMRFVDKVFCISKAIEGELDTLNLGNGKRLALPLGINLGRFSRGRTTGEDRQRMRRELGIAKDDFVVTVVAQIRPVKRLDVFLEAVRILVHELGAGKVKALIVGGAFESEESHALARRYEAFVEQEELSHQVRFLGVRDDVDSIYAVSHLSGLTSESEGLGLSLVEAAAMELPLFGTRIGGIPEVVIEGRNGHTFEVDDPAGLANIIHRLMDSSTERAKLGANSRSLVTEQYDVSHNAREMARHYDAPI